MQWNPVDAGDMIGDVHEIDKRTTFQPLVYPSQRKLAGPMHEE